MTSKLQRSEVSVAAAHTELDDFRRHARHQQAVIDDMQEDLRNKTKLLSSISVVAGKSVRLS